MSNLLPKIHFNTNISQLVYAVIVIVLIPSALAFNTLYLLRNLQRDMDFELNNKALLVESVIGLGLRDKMNSPVRIRNEINKIVQTLPEIKAIEVYQLKDDDLAPIVTTSEATQSVSDPVLNQLAWGSEKSYSKQIKAQVGKGQSERMWLVVSPIKDDASKKIGLINLYISASQIDEISNRTVRDSLFILFATMIGILLLLVNHFRFFEISILFKKLSELDQLKDDFISMASHELRAPLTVISSYTYVLLKDINKSPTQNINKYLSIIYQNSERLKTLVEDILDVSRIEQNRLKLDIVTLDLRQVIEDIVGDFQLQAQNKKIKLIYEKPEYPVMVSVDASKIKQVFYNLISNAIKYTLQGEVTISHKIQNKDIRTMIKDTGIGMSEVVRAKLFTKFYREYSDKIKDVPGTGLGLWITKQLIEKLGGKIVVESIENHGSQFIVIFPFKKAEKYADLASKPLVVRTNNS